MQRLDDFKPLKLLNLSDTRWDSFNNVINRLRQLYPDILDTLKYIIDDN